MVPARVFALTQGEADASNKVVTGQVSILNNLCHVLFDSGATHSYISLGMIDKLDKPSERFRTRFVTELPSGKVVLSSRIVRGVPIKIEDKELEGDLIELVIKDFDVILGMDWLARHGATIDCRRKKVTFDTPDGRNYGSWDKLQDYAPR